ncbi:MAG: hypothetical protein ACK44A_05460 [Roseateles sp.]
MNDSQAASLKRVWEMAQGNHGGANVCAKFLLGLYNGARFKFDLTELRRLDSEMWTHCVNVLQLDFLPKREVHEWLNLLYGCTDMGDRFELLACDWRIKGRCSKDWEKDLRARRAQRSAA